MNIITMQIYIRHNMQVPTIGLFNIQLQCREIFGRTNLKLHVVVFLQLMGQGHEGHTLKNGFL